MLWIVVRGKFFLLELRRLLSFFDLDLLILLSLNFLKLALAFCVDDC